MFFQNDHYVFSNDRCVFFGEASTEKKCADKKILSAQIIHEFFGSEQSALLGVGEVVQHGFNVLAGREHHLCPTNGRGVYLFGSCFSLAADAHPEAAQFAQAYNLSVGQSVLHHVHHGIQHGADVGAAHGTDFLNGFGQSG